jgi:N6-L-threonylcarbamoyladenine synthase
MKILGIETSCDDTGLAILTIEGPCFPPTIKIEVNSVSSQIEIHRPWGGVVPNLAKREHQKNLIPLFKETLLKIDQLHSGKFALASAKRKKLAVVFNKNPEWQQEFLKFVQSYLPPKIDLITVTQGPGLVPALWTGVNFSQALSLSWNIPLVPVNHLEAHLLSCWLPNNHFIAKPVYPLIALIVSGGHTQLILVKGFNHYQLLGETRDDAAGECFDKTARVLGLSYPGGPPIAQAAKKWQTVIKDQIKDIPREILEIKLPRPMLFAKNFDFSFSGLKTAVFYLDQKLPQSIKKSVFYPLKMADEIQRAINDVLIKKTLKATRTYQAKAIVLGGGVSANQQLRERLKKQSQENNLLFFRPSLGLAMDNAAMIALTGYCHQKTALTTEQIPLLQADANLSLA